jgi:hypothetical protein
MKINPTLAFTLVLLFLMLGGGFVSGLWGFTVGHAALKGVTQPDVRPTNKLATNKQSSTGKDGVEILREQDILTRVKAQMKARDKNSKADKNKDEEKTTSEDNQQKKQPEKSNQETKAGFPLKTQNQGVTLQVNSARQEGGSLLLNVSLKNEGSQAVRFLYSFLNVTDDRGRSLSAVTEGLPGEVPPTGQEFSGTVSIPSALLDDAKKLSLTLTDYPDQKLKLQTSEIPVQP